MEETTVWATCLNTTRAKDTETSMSIEVMTWKQILGLQRDTCSRTREEMMERET